MTTSCLPARRISRNDKRISWRLLQIGGDDPEIISVGAAQPGANRGERAEVARVQDQLRAERRAGQRILEQLVAIVRAHIDDKNELRPLSELASYGVADPGELADQQRNELGIAIDRNDDRIHWLLTKSSRA